MAFGNLALDLIRANRFGRLVCVRDGVYDRAPIDVINGPKKLVDIEHLYNVDRLRPRYETFQGQSLFIM
jgi:6-phosphofructokinase 1